MRALPALLCALVLAGCGSSNDGTRDMEAGTGITSGSARLTLGVNSFLWHASLDTLSFMPLVSADPFGGVIISEWYVAPSSPTERLKVTVYIMDRTLRADALKVVVFRQIRKRRRLGRWPAQPRNRTQAGRFHPHPRPRTAALAQHQRLTSWRVTTPRNRKDTGRREWDARALFATPAAVGQAQMLCAGDVPLSVGAHPYGPYRNYTMGDVIARFRPRPGL